MSGDLRGRKIIITRSAHAAKNIINTLTQLGAIATSMPLFATEGLFNEQQLKQLANNLQNYDLVVCISRSAAELILPYITDLAVIRWATIGPGTALILQRWGACDIIYPLNLPFDSNSLLLELQLRAKTLKNQCIMVLTGADGNNLLTQSLQGLGARVEVAALYRRTLPKMSPPQLRDALNTTPAIDMMVVTCVTSLANLLNLAEVVGINPLGIPLLAVSSRISTYALEKGFVNVRVANGMSDANIVTALLAWHNVSNR